MALGVLLLGAANVKNPAVCSWTTSSKHFVGLSSPPRVVIRNNSIRRKFSCVKCSAKEPQEQGGKQQPTPTLPLPADGWDVPWDYKVTLVGLLGWFASYFSTGVAATLLARNFGFGKGDIIDLDNEAVYVLFIQLIQTISSIGAINLVIDKYKPLPDDLFVYDLRKPLDLQRGWLLWAGIGILCAGGAIVLTSTITNYFLSEPPARERDALTQLLPLIGASSFSTGSLVIVTGVLAPLLEETVFRGFLLTSLTKRLPVPVAVLLSSAIFALAHLTPGEFPQLFALGTVIGFSYTRTRNMLTPILIHSAWNSGIVVALATLRMEGYNLHDLISN